MPRIKDNWAHETLLAPLFAMGDGLVGGLVCRGHTPARLVAQCAALDRRDDFATGSLRFTAEPSGGQPERARPPSVASGGQHQH